MWTAAVNCGFEFDERRADILLYFAALVGEFSLAPAQGSLGVRLISGPTAYCMLFGGTVTQDRSVVGNTTGGFKATSAPAPTSCPATASSCEGACGGSAETCFCDEACVVNGDCCQDFGDFCSP